MLTMSAMKMINRARMDTPAASKMAQVMGGNQEPDKVPLMPGPNVMATSPLVTQKTSETQNQVTIYTCAQKAQNLLMTALMNPTTWDTWMEPTLAMMEAIRALSKK